MTKQIILIGLLVSTITVPMSAQIELTDADLDGAVKTRSVQHTMNLCHDPSIIIDTINSPKSNPRYYIYGSHLGHAYTTSAEKYQTWHTWASYEDATSASKSLFADLNGNRILFSNAYSKYTPKKVKNSKGEEVDFAAADGGLFDAHGWQRKNGTVSGNEWAPDVIWNKTMQKWCMYMSLNSDNWCSAIVCFTSDDIQGPWVYQGPVVFSGFQGTYEHNSYKAADDWKYTDFQIATGETSLPERYKVSNHWGSFWPNCIDPCVFYDGEDIWMSYGSWSGGIFMLKINPENGLRDYTYTFPYEVSDKETAPGAANEKCTSDPYFGKKIAGGYYVSGEASYIQKIGNYYYLFMSYGGLVCNGGYQMRVFRATSPTGPYKDCNTSSGISALYSGYYLNYGADASKDEGVKIMGNYKWEFMKYADIAQGHNSATIDAEGRALLVYHSRQNIGHEGHSVRVHQLFVNEDGWLVAAPYEFNGETLTHDDAANASHFDDSDIIGNYQLMVHPYRQNTAALEFATPENIQLNADGKITGAYTGSWSHKANTDFITIKLKGLLNTTTSVTYRGVICKQTIDGITAPAICFTAVSSMAGTTSASGSVGTGNNPQTRGLCIWGSKADAKAAIKYTLDKINIETPIKNDVKLPEGKLGAIITWTSSDESVITSEGKLVSNGDACLTATISKDGYTYIKEFPVGNYSSDIQAVETDNTVNAKIYNVLGQPVDENYRGVVIRNGKKFIQK